MDLQNKPLTQFLEVRPARRTTNDGLAAELAKHLRARQHLGSAVVVTDEPLKLLAVVRKQWFKLARGLQRERASTVNAQKILHLTYAVTRMHNLAFVAKAPEERPDADVFFVGDTDLHQLPPRCFSLYLTTAVPTALLRQTILQLAPQSLIVDYADATTELAHELKPKAMLNEQVHVRWQAVVDFLEPLHITIAKIANEATTKPSVLDDTIDILLDYSTEFLQVAGTFQHALQLAQPIEPSREMQKQYKTLTQLAHRVQTLNTGKLSDFLDFITGDNSFFLRDSGAGFPTQKTALAELFMWHKAAGRFRICEKIETMLIRENFGLPF